VTAGAVGGAVGPRAVGTIIGKSMLTLWLSTPKPAVKLTTWKLVWSTTIPLSLISCAVSGRDVTSETRTLSMTSTVTASGTACSSVRPPLTRRMFSRTYRPVSASGGIARDSFGRAVSTIGEPKAGPRSCAKTRASAGNTAAPAPPATSVFTAVAVFFGTVCCAGLVCSPTGTMRICSRARTGRSAACAAAGASASTSITSPRPRDIMAARTGSSGCSTPFRPSG